jgi:acetylglutamate kinase
VTSALNSRVVVIKAGGAVARIDGALGALPMLMNDPSLGARFVVVHGGGKDITRWMEVASLPVRFKNGLRVTTPEALEIAIMVLRGLVNTSLVAAFAREGLRAIGLSGVDAAIIEAVPHPDGDLGMVGNAGRINVALLDAAIAMGYVPIVAPLGLDANGQVRNINADTVCGAIARAMRARAVVFLTDVPGVMDANGDILRRLTASDVEALIASGVVSGGMVPKLRACLAALASGANEVRIADGRDPEVLHAVLRGSDAVGTLISESKIQ